MISSIVVKVQSIKLNRASSVVTAVQRIILTNAQPAYKHNTPRQRTKGAITSKIKRAIKLKTSSARLAQLLLQPSLAFCFSLQPMAAYCPGLDGTLPLAAS